MFIEKLDEKVAVEEFFDVYGDETHTIIDEALSSKGIYKTNLKNDKGAFVFMISNSLTDKDAIFQLLKNTDLTDDEINLIRDSNSGSTILHQLANAIVNLFESSGTITSAEWSAFEYISENYPDLISTKDSQNYTPEEIISEQTQLTLNEKECYQI